MHAPENSDLNLRVVVGNEAGSVVHEGTKDRASTMLKTVIQTTGRRGSFVYMILGLGTLPNPSRYWMEVSAASEHLSSNMVHVIIRSSMASQGTLMGMIKLPDDVKRQEFLDAVKLAVDRFNGSGWHGIVEREERASMQADSQVLSQQIRRRVESNDDLTPERAVPRPTPIDGQTALALARGETVRVGGGRLRQGPVPHSPVRTPPVVRPLSARSAIQPGIGAELAAKSGGTPWASPRSARTALSIPSETEGSVMDHGVTSQTVVISEGEGHAPETVRRAQAMLTFLLKAVNLPPVGKCRFEITGSAETHLRDYKKPHVALGGDGDPSVIRVALRSRGSRDGTLIGRLHLPEGVDRNEFLATLSQTAGNFNDHDGWYEAFEILSDVGEQERALPPATARSTTPAALKSPVPLPTQPEGVPMATTKPLEDEAKLAEFLIAALQLPEVENGVITTGMVTTLIKQRFNPTNPKTFAGPLFAKLKSLGHVLHTGYGQFQVTQAFIDARQLDIRIKVRPEYHKGDAGAKKTGTRGNGVHREPTLAELLQNRQTMEAMIRETALREHRALNQSIADLQANLEAAQAALSAFEEEHATLLRAEAVPAHVPVATGTKADRPH